mgnify:CR=1 FL=1
MAGIMTTGIIPPVATNQAATVPDIMAGVIIETKRGLPYHAAVPFAVEGFVQEGQKAVERCAANLR